MLVRTGAIPRTAGWRMEMSRAIMSAAAAGLSAWAAPAVRIRRRAPPMGRPGERAGGRSSAGGPASTPRTGR